MVKTVMKRRKTPSRKYKSYSNAPIVYPSPYQSMLLYFNEINSFTDTGATAAFFAGAYRVQRQVAHINIRPYFSQYRVEKVTVRLQFSEGATQNQCFMATTHSADGATTAASTPTITTIRNYRDSQMYQIGQNCPKKVWYFNHNDPNECTYRDVAAATITNDDEFAQGGVQFYVTQVIGAGITSVTALMTYKVRYFGKQAIAI